jgi:isopenicillin-N epimerase
VRDKVKKNEERGWRAVRRQFLLGPREVYLNTGSWGVQPRPVYERLTRELRALERSPTAARVPLRAKVARSRASLAGFLGASAEDVAFTVNVTVAVNMVVNGLDFKPGDEILASDQEYGAIDNCLRHAELRHGVVVRRARIPIPPPGPEPIIAAFGAGLTPRTRLVLCSHVATRTGLIMPIKRIAALAHERGALMLVDGAHAPGMIPLDLADYGCDYYAGNCHKWLCAPKGTGFLHAQPGVQDRLHHVIVSWGYPGKDESADDRDASGRPAINGGPYMWGLENWGTLELASFAAVEAAVDFQLAIGRERIAARGRALAAYLRERMSAFGWAELVTPRHAELSGSISAFRLAGLGDIDLREELYTRYRISTPVHRADDGRHQQRVSTHICNGTDDVDALIDALAHIRRRSSVQA